MFKRRIFALACAWWISLACAHAVEIVVASYNLENYFLQKHQFTAPKPQSQLAAVARIVKEINPDILGVCEMGTREDFEHFKKQLAEEGLRFSDFEYLEAADSDRHVALLSRFPIVARNSVADAAFQLNGQAQRVKRGFLDVTIQLGAGDNLRLVGVHLKSKRDTPEGEAILRRHEARLLREHLDDILAHDEGARVLAYGDFNDTKDQPAIHEISGRRSTKRYMADLELEDSLGDRWTHFWKTADSYTRIDYMFASRALLPAIVAGKCRVYRSDHWNEGSDHRPIVATIRVTD